MTQSHQHNLKFKLKVAALKGLLKTVWLGVSKINIEGEEHILPFIENDQPVILCYWHQAHIMGLKYLLDLRKHKGFKISALVSPSKDGELAATAMKDWEVDVVRGSSSRTGAQAMRDVYEIIKRGFSPVITPDGPRGPIYEFKQGAVMISQIANAPMIPIGIECSNAWHLGSWDKFMIPKPFSNVTIRIGEPVTAEKKLSQDKMKMMCKTMQETICLLGNHQ